MYNKHPPSRNQRSKTFKVKQVLQICVLFGVCFWLIYQMTHSDDKNNAFDENISLETNFHSLKFGGRKGIQDPLEVKHLILMEKKDENILEDDMREKSKMEIEHEGDILDEKREREEIDKNENENKNEDEDTRNEDSSHLEEHDHEAREEQYKGDDASSAVTHESESVSAENDIRNFENTIEKMETNGLVGENAANNAEKSEIAENKISLNVLMKKEGKSGILSSKQDEASVSNSILSAIDVSGKKKINKDKMEKENGNLESGKKTIESKTLPDIRKEGNNDEEIAAE